MTLCCPSVRVISPPKLFSLLIAFFEVGKSAKKREERRRTPTNLKEKCVSHNRSKRQKERKSNEIYKLKRKVVLRLLKKRETKTRYRKMIVSIVQDFTPLSRGCVSFCLSFFLLI